MSSTSVEGSRAEPARMRSDASVARAARSPSVDASQVAISKSTCGIVAILPSGEDLSVERIAPADRIAVIMALLRATDWSSEAHARTRRFEVVSEEVLTDGEDLALALSVTADTRPALDRFMAGRGKPFRAVVIAQPDRGWGEQAIGSDGDAMALALSAKQLLRELRSKYGLPARTHLFPAVPVGFAVFLGQALNAVGEVVSYEMAAGDTYQQAVTLPGGRLPTTITNSYRLYEDHRDDDRISDHEDPSPVLDERPAAYHCNLHKGPNLSGIDPDTGTVAPLFHPRRDTWDDHLRWKVPRSWDGRQPGGRPHVC
jgi:hypothetical protein